MKYLGYLVAFILGAGVTWFGLSLVEKDEKPELETEINVEKEVVIKEMMLEKASLNEGGKVEVEVIVESDSGDEISQELVQAKQQLAVMQATNETLSERIQQFESKIQNNKKDEQNNSEIDLFAGIPESHLKMLKPDENKRKTLDEIHRDFVEEEEDISWATLKEQQLNYYFTGHRLSNFVQLHLVDCKATMCEVLGTETPSDNEAWFTMADELHKEPWANFSGNNTSSTNGEDDNKIFVTILTKSDK